MDKNHSPTFTYPTHLDNYPPPITTTNQIKHTPTMAINTTTTTTMASLLNPKPIYNIKRYPFPKCPSKSSLLSITSCSVSAKIGEWEFGLKGKKGKKIEMGIIGAMASLVNPKPIYNIKQYPFPKCPSKSSRTSCSVSTKTGDWELLGKGKKGKKIEMGIIGGILASTIVMGFGLNEADATRIEYYATVSDPPCLLTSVPSGLAYCDLLPGSGPTAPYNQLINVHYTARFADERVFDSSYKRGRPLTMRIGVGKVIRGLDQGIFGGGGVPPMQVGGKRKLRIPPELAYGPEPAGCFSGDCNIPANATLLYDINFVGIYSGNRK